MKEMRYKVLGMSCTACAKTIEDTINKNKAISSARVNFAAETAFVKYDENQISSKQIVDEIKKIGYSLEYDESENDTNGKNVSLSYKILGMTCTSCANGLEKALNSTDGIENATVNFSSETLNVSYNPKLISSADIERAVITAGFKTAAPELENDDLEEKIYHIASRRMIYSVVLSSVIMLLMILKMFGIPIPQYNLITLLLAFPVVFIFGFDVHKSSWNSVKHKSANMNVLVTLGSLPPYLIGIASLFYAVQTFVEMSATIMTFHLLGKYLETKAKGKTSAAIKKLVQLGVKTARIIIDGEVKEMPVSALKPGDIMLVKPSEKIPTDGIIVEGKSTVDESMVTGESVPIVKGVDDEVIGATINHQGLIKVKVTKTGKDTFLSQVISLVEQCQGSKVPIQEFADRVTGYFVPIIIVIAFATFFSYLVFPSFHRGIIEWGATFLPWINPEASQLTLAFITATAVFVIACPCALGLGTPTALMVGSGIGAQLGILIRDGSAVQTLREVKAVAFDKTGTITKGKPEVTDVIVVKDGATPFNSPLLARGIEEEEIPMQVSESDEIVVKDGATPFNSPLRARGIREEEISPQARGMREEGIEKNVSSSINEAEKRLIYLTASLESGSEHPLANAVIAKAKSMNINLSEAKEISIEPGMGIIGIVDDRKIIVGNLEMLENHQITIEGISDSIVDLEREAKTVLLIAEEGILIGMMALSDTIKEDAVDAVQKLNEMGIETVMITGDNEIAARVMADKVGIKSVIAKVLPQGKVDAVLSLQQKYGIVAMVGDGINDAPALKQANVGIALGSGTDVAIESADITLIRGNLMNVVNAISLSKAIFRKIKENFFWAWFYNAVAIPVAILGLLHPMIGAGAMSLSSLNVVYNSLRLRKVKL